MRKVIAVYCVYMNFHILINLFSFPCPIDFQRTFSALPFYISNFFFHYHLYLHVFSPVIVNIILYFFFPSNNILLFSNWSWGMHAYELKSNLASVTK